VNLKRSYYCRLKSGKVMIINKNNEATEEFHCHPLGTVAGPETLIKVPYTDVEKTGTDLKFLKMYRY